jgi:glycine dehydrogenase subunit 1
MWDGSTATAEAAMMATRVTRRSRVVLSGGLHPHYAAVTKGICEANKITVAAASLAVDGESSVVGLIDENTAAVIVQTPNLFGTLTDITAIAEAAHAKGALVIAVFTECVSLGLVESPGAMGADIVAGEGQSIGNALNFGGPYVGLFATREKFVRQMPGRLAGETVDAEGKRGFVLTLSTREQHIRREKATSNICTNSGLCALAWTIHMTLLGEAGIAKLARLNHERACDLADALQAVPGADVLTPRFFNEFAVKLSRPAAEVVETLAHKGVLAGVPVSRLAPKAGMDDVLLVAATECNTDDEIALFARELKGAL